MRELLSKALLPVSGEEEARTNRILAATFYRVRPLPFGHSADVIRLEQHKQNFLALNSGGRGR